MRQVGKYIYIKREREKEKRKVELVEQGDEFKRRKGGEKKKVERGR